MRLVNIGAGEITDRLTILAIKILEAHIRGADAKHFETERAVLLEKIAIRPLTGRTLEHALDLAAVNGRLWQAEDELRAWRQYPATGNAYSPGDLDTIRQVAFRIQDLNDQRAGLIEEINQKAGDFLGQEKVYDRSVSTPTRRPVTVRPADSAGRPAGVVPTEDSRAQSGTA